MIKHLSFVGRVSIAKSVIEVVPIYPMMTIALLESCLNEIQMLQWNFIWDDDDDRGKHVHYVNWKCCDKSEGFGSAWLPESECNEQCLSNEAWLGSEKWR